MLTYFTIFNAKPAINLLIKGIHGMVLIRSQNALCLTTATGPTMVSKRMKTDFILRAPKSIQIRQVGWTYGIETA